MMITTKGRYALRVMVDLALHKDEGYITLNDISQRQAISSKYLESIVAILNKEKLVLSKRGKNGGYKLAKKASDYSVYEILASCQTLVPVKCLAMNKNICQRKKDCYTVKLWESLEKMNKNYLEHITLENLVNQNFKDFSC